MRIPSGSSAIQPTQPIAGVLPSARWTAEERRQVYRQLLGPPGASGDARPNRDFNDLWLRFIASVAQFKGGSQPSVSGETVDRLAREVAARSGPTVATTFAARDLWQVIDQVAGAELGGAANTTRFRSMAETGGAIFEWLTKADAASGIGEDLARAAEQWVALAVTPGADAASMSPDDAARRVSTWSQSLRAASKLGDGDTRITGTLLFSGAAGTGKTLAAHWLATSLEHDVFRVDLSRLVSKYIGETEKNLARVFADARRADAVLLFDEADALFGKRTDVRGAHDRYANPDVASLRRQIESVDGLVILSTSDPAALSPDLLKKLRAVVAFPLPPPP